MKPTFTTVSKMFALAALTALAALAATFHAAAQTQRVERAQPLYATTQPIAGSAATPAGPAPQGVALRNGDTVEVRLANVPIEDAQQFTALYTIDESGMLNLPYIGMIKAGGLPPSQVMVNIQNKLITDGIYTNPTVTVNPPAGARFISVGGAVRAPGRIQYSSDLTLMSTINAAGGKSDFAGDEIHLTRKGQIIKYSWKRLHKDPSKDPAIEPGDQIEIEESWY